MTAQIALWIAGVCSVIVALYHGVKGDAIVQGLAIPSAADKALMRGSFHIGTMGWLVGGIVILLASSMAPGSTRDAIACAYAALFGIPAISLIIMERGRPSIAMALLCIIVISLVCSIIL